MKNITFTLIFLASSSSAEICLVRENDAVHPRLNVELFLEKTDLNRTFYIDRATTQAECTSEPCIFSKDDMFMLDRSGGNLTLVWIKKSNKVVRMKVTVQEKIHGKHRFTFLKSEAKDDYVYYLMKRGNLPCELFSRWSPNQYSQKWCSMYTIEAFDTKSNPTNHIKPDDPAAELKLCLIPFQPGTGTGGEPPP